ncbi:MAG TPA: hypothetical protein VG367_04885 [Mucilaginibacter sp.]|jgi:hypothetical protein|nr:hypothetical protein [Mucilaginibacter sp.]
MTKARNPGQKRPVRAKSDPDSYRDEHSKSEMEVHHHPDLEHKHKPWKEYLLEGFMIFIAVMMGFVAENIREGISDREHVRQLTGQLVQDLKADTAGLNNIYKAETQILAADDSLYALLLPPLSKANMKKIEETIIATHSMWPFHPSGGAIAAIKNELHLKQLANSKIISYIARYEGHIELLRIVQNITIEYQHNYIDPFLLLHFTPANLKSAFDKRIIKDAQMRNLTQNDLIQLSADMTLIRVNTFELVQNNRRLKDDATKLLQYVKEQYHPEGE